MSLVTDVLASIKPSTTSNKDIAVTHMEEMIAQSEKNRDNVYKALESRYGALSAGLHDTLKLQENMESCLNSMTNVDNRIQDEILGHIESSVGEVGRVSRRWKEVVGELEAANLLLEIHTLFEKTNQAQLDQEYSVAAKSLISIQNLLENVSEQEIESQLDIIGAIREELIIRRNGLIFSIGEIWINTIAWDEEKLSDGTASMTLSIRPLSNSMLEFDVIQEMVVALEELGELKRRMRTFGKLFLQHFISPIISGGASLSLSTLNDLYLFRVDKSDKENILDKSAVEALKTIQELVTALDKVLLHVKIKKEVSCSSLVNLLGREIGEDFTKMILKDCLAEAVPCSKKDLKSFDDVTVQTQEFQKYFVSIGFYSSDQKSLLDYAANVEVVFSNKACANLLSKARDLMMKPLHVTASIGPLSPDGPLVAIDESGITIESTTQQLSRFLSEQTFNLPSCQVSVSVCHLVDLIYETLEEACQSSPEYAGRLFYTVRNILSLYCNVVPTAHSETLATIPQSAALVHNNSFFLAHHALLLGHQYRHKLPVALRDSSLTTADIAQVIRSCGSEVFLQSMKSHKNCLQETLREGLGLPSLGCESSAVASAESSVKQCLQQFERLHSVWQNVLPNTIYTTAIGTLISGVVEDIVVRIIRLQDISADSALGLISVLNLLKNKVPSFFKVKDCSETSENDVIRAVKLWGKMCELIIVLGANLRELLDRWSDGKGPLALHFTAEEVKLLIRALFQNTDRRAQVLSSIL